MRQPGTNRRRFPGKNGARLQPFWKGSQATTKSHCSRSFAWFIPKWEAGSPCEENRSVRPVRSFSRMSAQPATSRAVFAVYAANRSENLDSSLPATIRFARRRPIGSLSSWHPSKFPASRHKRLRARRFSAASLRQTYLSRSTVLADPPMVVTGSHGYRPTQRRDSGKDWIPVSARTAISKLRAKPRSLPLVSIPHAVTKFLPAFSPQGFSPIVLGRVRKEVPKEILIHNYCSPYAPSGTHAIPLITSRSTRMSRDPLFRNDFFRGADTPPYCAAPLM